MIINTLDELICEINNIKDFNSLETVLKKYNGEDWRKYIKHNKKTYTRVKIYEQFEFEIYLIIWDSNCKTPIHDHADNGCWLKVLDGKIHEKKYSTNLDLIHDHIYENGYVSYMNNTIGFHSIINSDKISYTLHIYSPPNHKTIYFT